MALDHFFRSKTLKAEGRFSKKVLARVPKRVLKRLRFAPHDPDNY